MLLRFIPCSLGFDVDKFIEDKQLEEDLAADLKGTMLSDRMKFWVQIKSTPVAPLPLPFPIFRYLGRG